MTPESVSPIPPPTPMTADNDDNAAGTLLDGNVVRTMAKDNGKMPPPTPITARPAMRTPIVSASALTTAPTPTTISTPDSTRPLS